MPDTGNTTGTPVKLVDAVDANQPALGTGTNPLRVDPTGTTVQPVSIQGGSPSNPAASPTGAAVPADASYNGVNVAGNLIGQTGFSLTNSKAAACAIVDGNGNQITSFGGGSVTLSSFHLVSLGSTNANGLKSGAGQVYAVSVFCNAAYPIYLKFHNTNTPTAGSGVVKTFGVQAGTERDQYIVAGMQFSTGIGISIVKGIADTDATAVLASDCVVDILYA